MKQYRKIGVVALLAVLLTLLCGCSAADFTLPSGVDMQPGETLALTDLVRYNGADLDALTTEDVTEMLAATEQLENIEFSFASTVPGVVTVDEAGIMTAGVTGEATVVVTCEALDYYAEMQVTVCTLPQTIVVEPAVQLAAGDTYQIGADVDRGAKNAQLLYTTGDDSVVTVDENGVVTAVGAGAADVTVTVAGSSLTSVCRVTVTETDAVQSITISRAAAELTPGDALRLAAEICMSPVTAENAKADTTWQSSDETVATVDADGVVTAMGEGTAVIRASAGNKTAACSLTVTAPGAATPETATAETAAEEEPKMEKTSADNIATPETATLESATPETATPETATLESATPENAAETGNTQKQKEPDTMPFGHGPVVQRQNKTATPETATPEGATPQPTKNENKNTAKPKAVATATPESATPESDTITETLDMDVFFETPETATSETATATPESAAATPETATPESALTEQTVRDTIAEVADAVGDFFNSLFGPRDE